MTGVALLHREIQCRAASNAADNTASLRASQNRKPHPAHYLVDRLLRAIDKLKQRHPGIDFTMRWVPGHRGIEGNERADEEAKKAARGDSSPVEDLPGWLREKLPVSVSKLRQCLHDTIKQKAKEEWRNSPRAEKMDRIDSGMPSNAYRKLAERLPRRHASILIQLRTEHAPLQRHLHRIRQVDSPICQRRVDVLLGGGELEAEQARLLLHRARLGCMDISVHVTTHRARHGWLGTEGSAWGMAMLVVWRNSPASPALLAMASLPLIPFFRCESPATLELIAVAYNVSLGGYDVFPASSLLAMASLPLIPFFRCESPATLELIAVAYNALFTPSSSESPASPCAARTHNLKFVKHGRHMK
ncbi:uncharacterized protein C8Q71DRAFT_856224 [Rhodofomes roseus]|uniref:RNase H type-1 domain-containing protein n=1 Tax=Rhodofomes roseus TaxID=34475 RepID=A0ABQ8KJE6_9APHY|nr:uncharacterized protein C8Q71DRAFT_856224 [Rhodofomes roseus]KAH9838262.1 hypothetical protein C8Q71DRAFT_856224 [Rhodofomes roseus]